MDGPSLSTAELDPRRKKLLYRAWHRGMKEMDLLLGHYADAKLPSMSEEKLVELEKLIEVPDQHLFCWITGTEDVPPNYNGPVYRAMVDFYASSSDAVRAM